MERNSRACRVLGTRGGDDEEAGHRAQYARALRLTRADWVRLLLLWLGGIDLRLTRLAVPPLIPSIHHALNLDEKSVGALVSGPVLLLAIASVPGSLLIAKLGVRGALLVGLASVAVFAALRGYGPSIPVLFTATFLMGVGVALSQPAFPSLVREWFPRRIAIATAVYANGILIGETLPTVFTTPVGVLPLAHGDWRWAIASWSALVLVSAIAIGAAAPARTAGPAGPPRWGPRRGQGPGVRHRLGMGVASTAHFCANAFIPDLFH